MDPTGAVPAAWYPGMEGGHALADVVFGEVEPGGRLPCTWPTSTTRLPPFRRFARKVRYGPLHGYRMMEATGQRPAFWFGHGLGYTATEWSEPRLLSVAAGADGGRVAVVEVAVTNPGERQVLDVVQAYVPEVLGTHPAPLNALRGFARVLVLPGATTVARLAVALPDAADRVLVGRSADPDGLVAVRVPWVAPADESVDSPS
ncbi:MAG: glycoside hydrolase family 3 C-terminal domain-containing protein [Acidimicrobiales bacterium]